MRNLSPCHAVRNVVPALAFAVSTAALGFAQIPHYEVIYESQVPPGGTSSLADFQSFTAGEDQGWLAVRGAFEAGAPVFTAIYGDLSGADAAGPRQLRLPQTLAGVEQFTIQRPSLAAGQIAYLSEDSSADRVRAAWLDDALIAQEGTSVGVGGGAGVWTRIRRVHAATNGTLLIRGDLQTPMGELPSLVEFPSGSVLLQEDQQVPGTGETIQFLLGFHRSSNGEYVVALVRLAPSNDRAILLDGEILTLPGGGVARSGVDATPSVTSGFLYPDATWRDFFRLRVNSEGVVAFQADVQTTNGTRSITIRDGREVRIEGASMPQEIDDRGFLLYEDSNFGLRGAAFETRYLRESASDIDVDGDGLADPGFLIEPPFSTPGHVDMTGSGTVYATATLEDPMGDRVSVVVRRDLTSDSEVVCPGEPNSTGRPARVSAFGTSVVSYNRAELLAIGLPPDAIALPLFSLVPNAGGVQPGGSQGTLCLGGAIGRGLSSLIFARAEGMGGSPFLLNQLPQPSGPVSVQAGETWYAQLWYRDTVQGVSTNNFSDAIALTFR